MPNYILEAKQAAAIKQLIAEKNQSMDDDLIHDMIEGETDFYEALVSVVDAINENSAMVEAIATRQKDLAERKSRFQHKSEALRELLQEMMEIAGERKAVLPEATISLTAARPKVIIGDESKIPDQFFKIEKKLDKAALLEALQRTAGVSGAMLSNGGQTVTIRRK